MAKIYLLHLLSRILLRTFPHRLFDRNSVCNRKVRMLDSFISFQNVMILWHLQRWPNVLKNQHTLIFDIVDVSQSVVTIFKCLIVLWPVCIRLICPPSLWHNSYYFHFLLCFLIQPACFQLSCTFPAPDLETVLDSHEEPRWLLVGNYINKWWRKRVCFGLVVISGLFSGQSFNAKNTIPWVHTDISKFKLRFAEFFISLIMYLYFLSPILKILVLRNIITLMLSINIFQKPQYECYYW